MAAEAQLQKRAKNLGKYAEPKPIFQSLWDHSDVNGNCWIWNGTRDRNGYGVIKPLKIKNLAVHRAAYALFHPEWNWSGCVLHRCDNPPCWNPAHLFLGTQADNMRDMKEKGRGRNQRVSGESNPNAKLNWDTVRSIRNSFSRGISRSEICEKFEVARYTVNAILRGATWREE